MADRAHSTSRRALLVGLSATPLVTMPALAGRSDPDAALLSTPTPISADPHLAAMPNLLRLWSEHRRTMEGWGHPTGTAECNAADDAHVALLDASMAVTELPPPRTLEGLAAVAVAVALAFEGYVTDPSNWPDHAFHTLVLAALSVSGADMPSDWAGMVHTPKPHVDDLIAIGEAARA